MQEADRPPWLQGWRRGWPPARIPRAPHLPSAWGPAGNPAPWKAGDVAVGFPSVTSAPGPGLIRTQACEAASEASTQRRGAVREPADSLGGWAGAGPWEDGLARVPAGRIARWSPRGPRPGAETQLPVEPVGQLICFLVFTHAGCAGSWPSQDL